MRLYNAKQMLEISGGRALPAINGNGANYDLVRAILEAADELRSPIIVGAYMPNLEYRGYEYFTLLVRHLARDLDIPVCISLDHGKDEQAVMQAVRAGFGHVMFDYASHPIEENIEATNRVSRLVRPLGISVEAEIGNIIISAEGQQRAATTPLDEVAAFAARADVDFLAVGVGTTHGIFEKQDTIDFDYIGKVRAITSLPLVLHGTCGVSMEDIYRCVAAGMQKINFGEALRMNYIGYFNELSETMDHQLHTWRIMRAAKDRIKEDVKTIIRAVGSDGLADRL